MSDGGLENSSYICGLKNNDVVEEPNFEYQYDLTYRKSFAARLSILTGWIDTADASQFLEDLKPLMAVCGER